MKKRLLALLLVSVMLVASTATGVSALALGEGQARILEPEDYYPLWVGDIQVNSYNRFDIFSGKHRIDDEQVLNDWRSPYTMYGDAYYEPETHTLTLKDAFIDYSGTGEIKAAEDKANSEGIDFYDYEWGAIHAEFDRDVTLTIKVLGDCVIQSDVFAILSTGNVALDIAPDAMLTMYGSVWAFDFDAYGDFMNESGIIAENKWEAQVDEVEYWLGLIGDLYVAAGKITEGELPDWITAEKIKYFKALFGTDYTSWDDIDELGYGYCYSEYLQSLDNDKIIDDIFSDITVTGGRMNVVCWPNVGVVHRGLLTNGTEQSNELSIPLVRRSAFSFSSGILGYDVRLEDTLLTVENCTTGIGILKSHNYPSLMVENKLFLDNSLAYFTTALYDQDASVRLNDALKVSGDVIYDGYSTAFVRNGVESVGSYSAKGSYGYVDFTERQKADYTNWNYASYNDYTFMPLEIEEGYFVFDYYHPKDYLNAKWDRLRASASTVWLQSDSFCSEKVYYDEIKDNGLYNVESPYPEFVRTAVSSVIGTIREFLPIFIDDPFYGDNALFFQKVDGGYIVRESYALPYGKMRGNSFIVNPIIDPVSPFVPAYLLGTVRLGDPLTVVLYEDGELDVWTTGNTGFLGKVKAIGTVMKWNSRTHTLSVDLYDWNTKEYSCTAYLTNVIRPFKLNENISADIYYRTSWSATFTPTPLKLYREEQNGGHTFVTVKEEELYHGKGPIEVNSAFEPEEEVLIEDGHHLLRCTNCGKVKYEVCSYDPKTHQCVCGKMDPEYTKVTVDDIRVSTSFSKLLKITTFNITVKSKSGLPVFVSYRFGGTNWLPYVLPISTLPGQHVARMDIRVTDASKNESYFVWEEGKGVSEWDPNPHDSGK